MRVGGHISKSFSISLIVVLDSAYTSNIIFVAVVACQLNGNCFPKGAVCGCWELQ